MDELSTDTSRCRVVVSIATYLQTDLGDTQMSTSNWTNADLAQLTQLAVGIAETESYCDYCLIAEVPLGDKYCAPCTQDIIDALWQDHFDRLAVIHCEQTAIENGWY